MLVYIVSVDLRIRPDTVLVVLDHNMFLTLVPNQERMVLGITFVLQFFLLKTQGANL